MSLLRTLHLLIALLVPALLGTLAGLLTWLFTRDRRRTINAVATVVGALGPRLAGLQLKIQAAGEFPRPAIITFNHQSGLDPVIMCALIRRDVVGVAKDGLRHNPVLGPLLKVTGTIFLGGRAERRQRVLDQAEAVIRSGCSIVLAPEGTRRAGLALGTFHSGACELAQRCGVPLVAVVIHNSGERLAPRSRLLFPGPVRITVLPARRIAPDADIATATHSLEQDYVETLGHG